MLAVIPVLESRPTHAPVPTVFKMLEDDLPHGRPAPVFVDDATRASILQRFESLMRQGRVPAPASPG
ncbi:MAG TPA: hypothetical protein DEP35_06175 [Deltaproteobacteria bacterium]|nr:hypothetical protein [Deltaproteobacteria bacterium]